MLYSVLHLHCAIMGVHVWRRGAAEMFAFNILLMAFCQDLSVLCKISLFTVILQLLVMLPPFFFLIVCCTDTQNDLGFLISQVTETDIYLMCSLEGTGDISGRHSLSMLIWPEEKPMIKCLCRLKTYTGDIFIHEHVFHPTNDSPGHTERCNSSLPSKILALCSFD